MAEAATEIKITVNIDASEAKQFVDDMNMLSMLSMQLAHVGRQKAGMGPVITTAAYELHRIATNLSKLKMA